MSAQTTVRRLHPLDLARQREVLRRGRDAQVDVAPLGTEQQMPRLRRHAAHTRDQWRWRPAVEGEDSGNLVDEGGGSTQINVNGPQEY